MSRDTGLSGSVPLTALFFDVLHLDGTDLIDAPARERFQALAGVVPEGARAPRVVTDEPGVADEFNARMIALGHEGVVVKDLQAPYAAGQRGAAWVKVKPRHTLDLVVLAVEWGSGRRQGLLSNIHLGARDGAGFTMLGKTFKGMTDDLLRWQTERFQDLSIDDAAARRCSDDPDLGPGVVAVRPVQVVEIAVDGIQRSTRYGAGVALRFARVVRYRDDKGPADADTIDHVRSLGSG